MPRRTLPSLAMPALPRQAWPRHPVPCLSCPAGPCRAIPSRAQRSPHGRREPRPRLAVTLPAPPGWSAPPAACRPRRSVRQRRVPGVILPLDVGAQPRRAVRALRFAPVRSPGFRMPCRERAVELVGGRGMRGRTGDWEWGPVRSRVRARRSRGACGDSGLHRAQPPSCRPVVQSAHQLTSSLGGLPH